MIIDQPYIVVLLDKAGKIIFKGPVSSWQVNLGHIQEGTVSFVVDSLTEEDAEEGVDGLLYTCISCDKTFIGEAHYLCPECRL